MAQTLFDRHDSLRRARIATIIELLCDRFPQTFSRHGPKPLKVGIYDDALAALGGAAIVWPLAGRAQQRERMRRIGISLNNAADGPVAATGLTVQVGWTVVLEPGNFKRIIARIAPGDWEAIGRAR